MTPKNLLVYRDKEALVRAAALLIAGEIREVLRSKETCTFSLAGGATPAPAYRMLVDEQIVGSLPLERVEVFFGDERCVAADHPDSNYNMAKTSFGEGFSRFKKVHRIEAEGDRDAAASAYAAVLPASLDIQLLGMGPDAHIASLFPDSPLFGESPKVKAAAVYCAKPPPWRISVSPAVIRAAERTFVLAAGEEKASALFAVFNEPVDPQKRPAQTAIEATWLVDEAAASRLTLK